MGRWLFLFVVLFVTGFGGNSPAEAASRLAQETSPYLQLHAADAVDWRPWGEAALAEARRDNKPILLAIGYSSCRWCHVLQRESYFDPAFGALVNRDFVPILVDREERPDVDSVYQLQALHLGQPTGWPLTLFLAPTGEAFFGGTYFPKDDVGGVPSFTRILNEVAAVWRDDPAGATAEAARAAQALRRALKPPPGTLDAAAIDGAARALLAAIDPFHGGFGASSKFPRLPALEALWRAHLKTGNEDFAQAVVHALSAMSEGALYDHVGGGFFRYTVDPQWRVPHYEKMLNVNAALTALLTEVWRETADPLLERRARETVAFLLGEMRLDSGGFAGSLDAESKDQAGHKDEGVFYLWSEAELRRVLGPDAGVFMAAFALAPLERRELTQPADPGTLYRTEAPITEPARVDAALGRLRAERAGRARPARDDKILADWSGMAIAALAEAGVAFNEAAWGAAAREAFADTVRRLEGSDGRLRHSWHAGRAGAPATLEGLARMIRAAIVLFEATGEARYLDRAERWARQVLGDHWDAAEGGFFQAAADAAPALARLKPVLDAPDASGNAAIADVLARLYFLTGDEELRARAERTLAALGGAALSEPLGSAGLLNAADTLRRGLQVVIVGGGGAADTQMLLRRAFAFSLPARALLVIAPGTCLPENHPAHGKGQIDGQATAYVCRGTVCSLPVTSEGEMAETIRDMRAGL